MAIKSDRYLVTGGSGFCGFEIVQYLQEKGHAVRVLDLAKLPQPLAGVELLQGDLRDARTALEACRGIDRVIHTAAKVPVTRAGKDFWSVNVEGTRQILDAAQKSGVKKITHISSSAIQLSETNPVPEDAPFHCVGEYAESKLAGEKVCEDYRKKGLSIDVIRPRTVLGPGRLGIFDLFFERIAEGKSIFLPGGGSNRIQLLHSRDLAECSYLASQHPSGETFNIGSASFATLREDLQALIDHAGTKTHLQSLPVAPVIFLLATLDRLNLSPLSAWHYMTFHRDFYFSNAKAKTHLGWQPRFGNQEILFTAYDSFLQNRRHKTQENLSQGHRHPLKKGFLHLLRLIP